MQERYHNYMLRRMKEDRMTQEASRSVWVTFRKEGVHMYPGADTDPKLQQASGTMYHS